MGVCDDADPQVPRSDPVDPANLRFPVFSWDYASWNSVAGSAEGIPLAASTISNAAIAVVKTTRLAVVKRIISDKLARRGGELRLRLHEGSRLLPNGRRKELY